MDYFRKGDQGTKSDATGKTIMIMNRLNSMRSHKGLKPISTFDFAQAVSKRLSKSGQPLIESVSKGMTTGGKTAPVSFPEERLDPPRSGQDARETGKSDFAKTAVRSIHRNSEEGF